ncbi:HET-domain-containing protein [Microthyrium microscopicum]|uniref:HET-domain-containing protein n=1 Tax=Microthyrium microscopicum TaxID=703497 RepID=A0A6A6U5S6_9PEZI|nr:HET-domain-containing protein [Microthyrium microscopicum]
MAGNASRLKRWTHRRLEKRKLYKSLLTNETRFLIICPADNLEDSIKCTLFTRPLWPDVEFYALSYVWGDPDVTEDIDVNGHALPVTTNLASALRNLRKIYSTHPVQRVYWIDAICINQKSTVERNQQVLRMQDIYSSADRVLSWLGDHPSLVSGLRALEMFVNIMRHLPSRSGAGAWRPSIFTHSTDFDLILGKEFWDLRLVFTDPYWSRIWIFQERLKARTMLLVCGQQMFPRSKLPTAYRSLKWVQRIWPKLQSFAVSDCHGLALLIRTIYNLEIDQTASHVTMLVHCWRMGFRTTDPRDMIYAISGAGSHHAAPNYKKSVHKIYTNHARAALKNGNIALVSCAGIGSRSSRLEGLPSWVPDWRHNGDENSAGMNLYLSKLTALSASIELDIRFRRPDILLWEGTVWQDITECIPANDLFYLNRVVSLYGTILLPIVGQHHASRLYALANLIVVFCWGDDGTVANRKGIEKQDHTSRAFMDIVLYYTWILFRSVAPLQDTTLTTQSWTSSTLALFRAAGQVSDDLNLVDLLIDLYFRHGDICSERIAANQKLEQLWKLDSMMSQLVQRSPNSDVLQAMEFSLRSTWTTSSTLLITKRGVLGRGPDLVTEGDALCFLKGFPTLFVLRKEASHYLMVGPCYVTGMMDGRLLKNLKKKTTKLKTLEIH